MGQPTAPTEAELEAYLDEALSSTEMARLESELRDQPELVQKLADINSRRDAGLHSLGEIWRRNRVSCPTRTELGSYLLEALDDEAAEYIRFHLEVVGCRWCEANLDDLKDLKLAGNLQPVQQRRQRFFQTSAGYLAK